MNTLIEPRIVSFIREHHLLALATSVNDRPYCASCFYTYLEDQNLFVFTSSKDTRHIENITANQCVSAVVALETKIVGKIRGIQVTGTVRELKENERKTAKIAYLKQFPYAILKQTILWGLQPDFIKMTDNRLGFGKKIVWQKKV